MPATMSSNVVTRALVDVYILLVMRIVSQWMERIRRVQSVAKRELPGGVLNAMYSYMVLNQVLAPSVPGRKQL